MGEAEGWGVGWIDGAGHSEWYAALAVANAVAEAATVAGTEAGIPTRTDAGTETNIESVACSCQRCGRGAGRASVAVS